ncbi:MAG: diguanylate cyclase [Planococcaceae bacterium]|nr:diguanylate cyclase [Planococcaceae bacterium]
MEKSYSQMLTQRIEKMVESWEKCEQVSHTEMYRFFHGLKGTAGSIGLMEWSNVAEDLTHLYHHQDESHVSDFLRVTAIEEMKKLIVPDDKLLADAEVASSSEKKFFMLLIDQDIDFVTLVKETMEKEGINVLIAPTAKKGMEMFFTLQPNFVLIDLSLPDEDGLNVLKQIASQARQQFIPIAITSSNATKHKAKLAYELDATDFIGKPLDMDIFIPFVKNRILNKEKILQFITKDELTGAYNRKHLTSTAPYHIQMHLQLGNALSLAMIDLDHFKKVNDTYGHLMGDDVLKVFAQTIHEECESDELLFRYGGEEFTILFLNKTGAEAEARLTKIKMAFTEKVFLHGTSPFQVTFSAGISMLKPNQTQLTELLDEADYALYQSKHNGRNRITLFAEKGVIELHKRPLNIAIIDDDVIVRNLIHSHFSNWKHPRFEVVINEYSDGLDFLNSDWFHEGEDHVLLLDSQMPNVMGVEVIENVREIYPAKNVLITMLSAQKDEEKILQALQLGADDYLLKPFHTREVIMRIQRLAERLFLS